MSQYFSDIDLATLHKTRLEEKIEYKLPWWTRYRQHSTTNNQQKPTAANTIRTSNSKRSATKSNSTDRKHGNEINAQQTASDATNDKINKNQNRNTSDKVVDRKHLNTNNGCDNIKEKQQQQYKEKAKTNKEAGVRQRHLIAEDFEYDEGYFSSSTRRRRSGTWP
jgi:hypothetical protein